MFHSLDDLKLFILWCKKNKVKKFTLEGNTVEISDYGFIESMPTVESTTLMEKAQETVELSKLEKEEQDREDEDLLFWSSDNT